MAIKPKLREIAVTWETISVEDLENELSKIFEIILEAELSGGDYGNIDEIAI